MISQRTGTLFYCGSINVVSELWHRPGGNGLAYINILVIPLVHDLLSRWFKASFSCPQVPSFMLLPSYSLQVSHHGDLVPGQDIHCQLKVLAIIPPLLTSFESNSLFGEFFLKLSSNATSLVKPSLLLSSRQKSLHFLCS